MRPTLKRTILTSKRTGRRYYLGRSGQRPNGRRYYVCSKADCEGRLVRDSDLFCPTHSQVQQPEDADESVLNDRSESIDEETPAEGQMNTDNDEQANDSISDDSSNNSAPLSSRQRTKANRDIQVDETTGERTFRDESSRLRYLCIDPSCTNMLKRRTDRYCQKHLIHDETKTPADSEEHQSPAPFSNTVKDRFRSPFSTSTTTKVENKSNENYSEADETVHNTPPLTGTNRSFRDASGKIRFLCFNPTCNSRLVRRSDTFCKRHLLDPQAQNNIKAISSDADKEEKKIPEIDVNHNNSETPSRQICSEPSFKKRKHEFQPTISSASRLSLIPVNKMVISATVLLDHQWKDILTFLRKFPEAELATNLNINNSTTHLLIDDSENSLHCTITKKIVQAALNEFPAELPYEIQSDSHTTVRSSHANDPHLFTKSYGFAIECRQCQGSITCNELIELIELAGGKVYDNDNHIEILIVLCDPNEKNLSKIKEKYLSINLTNIKYVTSDFLLKSIIKFEIQDVDKYSL